jgi:ABC-2 type transport system ATP-binding protein
MIEVRGLVKCYGERRVLRALDFTVPVGRICGFLGPNGSGKSTTMDILAGLLGPSDGDAKICGYSVVTQTREAKQRVGYLPDNPPLYDEMCVRDYVEYVGKLRGMRGSALKLAVDKVFIECDVMDESNRVIGHLSKGYKQRVALCAAMVHNPEVLILDEPTEGLDPSQIVHIRKLVRKLAKDRTVIMSSHILSEVQATCDDVIVIHQGEIVAKTSLDEESMKHGNYVFKMANDLERAQSWFKERNFVAEARVHDEESQSLVVQFSADFWNEKSPDNIAKVNTLLVQSGFSVAGIREEKTGIEELFFRAIKMNGNAQGM